jgi:hypothetical protein
MDPKHCYEGTKAFLKVKEQGLFAYFNQIPCSWIRIRIPNTDPDSQTNADPDPHTLR